MGHDINRKTVNRFYEENKELYRSVQRAQAKYLAKDPRELSPGLALGQLFLEYKNNKTMSLKMLGEIARYVKKGCPVSRREIQNNFGQRSTYSMDITMFCE